MRQKGIIKPNARREISEYFTFAHKTQNIPDVNSDATIDTLWYMEELG